MNRLLLSGYYGYGNAGDEAVLAGLVTGFRAARSAQELEITALSGNPGETRTAHGISAADRYQPAVLFREIARTDLFLSGGGSLLQDVTSAHSIFYYLGVVRLAQMLGKKTMFIAQGIGPLKLPRSRRLVAAVANRLELITVRDPDSAQLLREIGVTRTPLEVTADPALLLTPEQNLTRRFAPPSPSEGEGRRGTRRGEVFGVALRPWQGQEMLGALVAGACQTALAGSAARLISMQPASDNSLAEQFAAKWHQGESSAEKYAASGDLRSLLSSIAACDMMVGMRLHALILAAAAGVPSVALSYDPKVTAFMQSCGQGDAVYDLASPDTDRVTEILARVWAERFERAETLRTALPGLRASAQRNTDAALGLL